MTLGAFVSNETRPRYFSMLGRPRKSNNSRAASPRDSLLFRSGPNAKPPRRGRDGERVFFEAVTKLPPAFGSDVIQPLLPVMPEPDLSGASSDAEAPQGDGELGTRVMKGVSWTLAGTLWMQVLGVARTVALARLLSQADFGVAAMALTVIGALYTFTNTGVVGSVISSKFDDDDEMYRYVNLIWTMEILRGLLITVLLLALAFPFALFYKEPRLFPMLLALSLTPLCTSLQNVGLYLNSRQVEMKSITLHAFYSNTLTVLSTIVLAVLTRNYWALVWGQIAGAFVGMALSFVFSSYRPRLYWDKVMAIRAFDYGKHQFVIGLATYALTMMDNVAVGYWLGKVVLGVYVVAYTFCTLARTIINNAFNAVLFPAFAAAGREEDPARLRSLVERSFTLGTLAMAMLLTPLIAFAPAVLRIFYGTKWSEAVLPMRLLLLAGFFGGILVLFSAFFVGLDKPQYESKGKIWDALLFLVVLCPLTWYLGAAGAALAGVIAWAGAIIWRLKWANDLTDGALRRLPYLLVSALALGVVACALGVLPWAKAAGSWGLAFLLTTPTLPMAWTQVLIGAPVVSVFCMAIFSAIHPVAKQEIAGLKSKFGGKLKRG
ncbi:hypothetical protein EON83_18070 [bacterium]|nr:MAG: hypothetical protein EON83_18070 [bacterium]